MNVTYCEVMFISTEIVLHYYTVCFKFLWCRVCVCVCVRARVCVCVCVRACVCWCTCGTKPTEQRWITLA